VFQCLRERSTAGARGRPYGVGYRFDVAIAASWLVGSTQRRRRCAGFWLFLASNALWIAWGWHSAATALVLLQVALAAMNVRGMTKADAAKPSP
jgi:hypothetical protein